MKSSGVSGMHSTSPRTTSTSSGEEEHDKKLSTQKKEAPPNPDPTVFPQSLRDLEAQLGAIEGSIHAEVAKKVHHKIGDLSQDQFEALDRGAINAASLSPGVRSLLLLEVLRRKLKFKDSAEGFADMARKIAQLPASEATFQALLEGAKKQDPLKYESLGLSPKDTPEVAWEGTVHFDAYHGHVAPIKHAIRISKQLDPGTEDSRTYYCAPSSNAYYGPDGRASGNPFFFTKHFVKWSHGPDSYPTNPISLSEVKNDELEAFRTALKPVIEEMKAVSPGWEAMESPEEKDERAKAVEFMEQTLVAIDEALKQRQKLVAEAKQMQEELASALAPLGGAVQWLKNPEAGIRELGPIWGQ